MSEPEREEAMFLSKYEPQKLQRLYTQGGAACVYVRELVTAGKLQQSKVTQFLHSKTSYRKFSQARPKFNRMEAFSRFKKEIWFVNMVYFD